MFNSICSFPSLSTIPPTTNRKIFLNQNTQVATLNFQWLPVSKIQPPRHNISRWVQPLPPDYSNTTHLHVFEHPLHPTKGSLTTILPVLLVQSCLECPTHPQGPKWKTPFVFESAQMLPPLQNLSSDLQAGELSELHTSVLALIKFYFNHLSA